MKRRMRNCFKNFKKWVSSEYPELDIHPSKKEQGFTEISYPQANGDYFPPQACSRGIIINDDYCGPCCGPSTEELDLPDGSWKREYIEEGGYRDMLLYKGVSEEILDITVSSYFNDLEEANIIQDPIKKHRKSYKKFLKQK